MGLRRLSVNATASSLTTISSAVLLVLLYRFLIQTIGIESIGVWSLVFATGSVVRLAEFGMAGATTRYVALDLGAGERDRATATIGMALAFTVVAVGLCALVGYLPARALLASLIDEPEHVAAITSLLPWVLASHWLASVAQMLIGVLDGNQRTALRALAVVTSGVGQLVLAWTLVPRLGLAGLGPVQLGFMAIQVSLLLLAVLVTAHRPGAAWLGGTRARARELLRYGSGVQVMATAQLLFEPTVRWLLSAFSGFETTGYYELANRAVLQFRRALSAAFLMVVPYLANEIGRSGEDSARLVSTYRRSSAALLLIATPFYLLVGCALPFLLSWWADGYSREFVLLGYLCLVGWGVNTLAVPGFNLYLARGVLGPVMQTQLAIGVLNVILGLVGGYLLGGVGVALGAMGSLMLGSLVVIVRFHREYELGVASLVPPAVVPLLALGLPAFATFALVADATLARPSLPLAWLGLYAGLCVAFLALVWRDPLTAETRGRLSSRGPLGRARAA